MLSLPVANGSPGFGEADHNTRSILHARVSTLSVEHDDLDAVIDALASASTHDELVVARLKKRRLQIRDQIARVVAAAEGGEAIIPGDIFPFDADLDAPKSHAIAMAASKPARDSSSFIFFLLMLTLLVFGLVWSGMLDSLSQAVAQIYLLSLLVAANG